MRTNIVTSVVIADKNAHDSPMMPRLVTETATGFKIGEVCADKGYLSNDNLELVAGLGATAYIPFKSNSTEGVAGSMWEKMFHLFMLNREEFLKHYHQRSNVESTFSAIKRKFGDAVRSKADTAMRNEVLCNILAHNFCVCIAEWYALGIEPFFGGSQSEEDGPRVLRFARPG